MARGKKTSSEDKAKVIEAKVNNPDSSTRDIEKKTGVNYATASRILKKDLKQVATRSESIAKLIDDNNKLLNLTGSILWDDLLQRVENGETIRKDEIVRIRDLAFKQNEIAGMSDDQKKELTVKFEM